jgi:hypothetical protein
VAKTYTLGIAGEMQQNEDGSSRQKIIEGCRPGQPLILHRESDNPYDPNAVAVLTQAGACIGYIKRKDAPWVAEIMDRGREVSAVIKSIHNAGSLFSRKRGVVIDFTKD